MRVAKKNTTTVDMTTGSVSKLLIFYAMPLLLGNLFQVLYNTVDALVVGNFVGKDALAAIGSTNVIVNIIVFFFNGVSVGSGVIIGQYYGAKNYEKLHRSIETTFAMTFIASLFFTIVGVLMVPFMLRVMATPDDVMETATIYLCIYFAGISGLLIYNMGSGVLRAVGDTRQPLLFLIVSSILNILLDFLFVVGFRTGVAGAAYATILAQFISAALILWVLTRTDDIYKLVWKELIIDFSILKKMLAVGLPAGIQSMITSFSNVFVQSYINNFGSDCMAGWSCYSRLNQIVFLPVQSMSHSVTGFVSQNVGAQQYDRADRGTRAGLMISLYVNAALVVMLFLFADFATRMFIQEAAVIDYGVRFIHANAFFVLFNTVNHVMAGALRGRGDSKGPMFIMLLSFVGIRQIYLYYISRVFHNAIAVGFGYPVGWMFCCGIELLYYFARHREIPQN